MGTIKCHALDNWKACRSALATAIQSYLAACADLRLTCSHIQRPHKTRREAEPILLAIDAELAGLASEEEELGKARTSLSVLRNTSSALVPAHSLPPEVLAHIFLMAQCRPNGPVSDHTFAQVSTYWRATAVNLPTLWTYINITPAQVNYEYAILSLDRSDVLPIHLDISSEGVVDQWDGYPARPAWEEFLAIASRRVQTLNIFDSFREPETLLYEAMILLLHHGSEGVLKTLCIKRPDSDEYGDLCDFSAGLSDDILHSITILHLNDVMLAWTSSAYYNLIDLRLQFTEADEMVVSTSELAGVLGASPELTTLKLDYITITPSNDWNAENVVRLVHLEVLCLLFLSYDSWVALASVLSLSNCLGPLEVGVRYYAGNRFSEISHMVRDFLRGARVKTLAIPSFGDDDPQPALSLSATIPSLECLVLPDCNLLQFRGYDEVTGDEPKINADTPPRLPHLFLASSKLDLDKLKLIVSAYGVETLHLDRVLSLWMTDTGPPRDELRAALLDAFPRLTCLITDKDTTCKWPCRTMFD
ncbi:hypothetical protein FRC09_011402 [Ceratobasidium sp. 395]|nr:hypothetical protein FRC09_011402 [Ceratobasidium sp. 395]